MTNQQLTPKTDSKIIVPTVKEKAVSYRGYISIDQEMEREIAMFRFSPSETVIYTQKSFVMRDKG